MEVSPRSLNSFRYAIFWLGYLIEDAVAFMLRHIRRNHISGFLFLVGQPDISIGKFQSVCHLMVSPTDDCCLNHWFLQGLHDVVFIIPIICVSCNSSWKNNILTLFRAIWLLWNTVHTERQDKWLLLFLLIASFQSRN